MWANGYKMRTFLPVLSHSAEAILRWQLFALVVSENGLGFVCTARKLNGGFAQFKPGFYRNCPPGHRFLCHCHLDPQSPTKPAKGDFSFFLVTPASALFIFLPRPTSCTLSNLLAQSDPWLVSCTFQHKEFGIFFWLGCECEKGFTQYPPLPPKLHQIARFYLFLKWHSIVLYMCM